MAINSVTFSGNIGGDMEVRQTQNGKTIGNFSLPVDQGYGDNKKTSWLRCKVLGERAQKLQQYLTKGTPVTVTGQFVEETWKHSDGTDRHANVVIVDQLHFASSQGSQQRQPPAPPAGPGPRDPRGGGYQPQQSQGFQGQQQSQGFGTNAQQPNPQNGGGFNNDEPPF